MAIEQENPEIEEGPEFRPSKSSGVVIICPNNNFNDSSSNLSLDGDVTADVCASCREVLCDDGGNREFRITTQCSCSMNAAPPSGPSSMFVTLSSSSASVVSVSSVSDDEEDDEGVLRYYTRAEISRHDTEASAWIIAGDNVYDVTDYVESHPGGRYSIMKKIGGSVDCTRDLLFHSKRGQNIWKEYLIGKITDVPSKNGQPVIKEWWKFWEWT